MIKLVFQMCITAKTQSGGDFVCHILQKMKTVWLTLFLFEMIL